MPTNDRVSSSGIVSGLKMDLKGTLLIKYTLYIVDLDFIKVRIFEAMPLRGIVNHGVLFGPIEYHNAVGNQRCSFSFGRTSFINGSWSYTLM